MARIRSPPPLTAGVRLLMTIQIFGRFVEKWATGTKRSGRLLVIPREEMML